MERRKQKKVAAKGETIGKVKLGDIKSNYSCYSMGYLLGSEKVNIVKIIKECFFILLFGMVGVLFTILFHKKCFHFFYEHINSGNVSAHTYKTLGSGIISRVILIIISIFLSVFTVILIVDKIKENLIEVSEYDWAVLYKSLNDNGYVPHNFKNGYITVEKFKGKYICIDGNHRHSILLDIYGPDKIIDVVHCKFWV